MKIKFFYYLEKNIKNPYEIEHILSDHYPWFRVEFRDPDDFKYWRKYLKNLQSISKKNSFC